MCSTQENLSSGIANNKGADQPAQSDQHLCYSLSEKYISQACFMLNFIFWLVSVAEETGLSLALLKTQKTGFVASRPGISLRNDQIAGP